MAVAIRFRRADGDFYVYAQFVSLVVCVLFET